MNLAQYIAGAFLLHVRANRRFPSMTQASMAVLPASVHATVDGTPAAKRLEAKVSDASSMENRGSGLGLSSRPLLKVGCG